MLGKFQRMIIPRGGMALLELQSDETKKKRENTTTARIRAETTGISLMEFHAPGK